jgi:hypothetical protein
MMPAIPLMRCGDLGNAMNTQYRVRNAQQQERRSFSATAVIAVANQAPPLAWRMLELDCRSFQLFGRLLGRPFC